VIAHRLSTVVDSDKIVVLDDGRVVGEGTHSELLDSTPLYRELAQHQLLVPEENAG
jgi:ATP-binding cassette subfamily B protein